MRTAFAGLVAVQLGRRDQVLHDRGANDVAGPETQTKRVGG
ncbi:MAG: hypothetical protein ACK52I_35445 [Pseudomonadota bacterium]